jgi:hypothetical protein
MPFITVGSGASDVEAGTYPATLIAVNEKMIPSKFTDDPSGLAPAWEWVFSLDSGDEVNGLTSTYVTPKSRAFGYLVAMMGKDKVINGAGFDLIDLIGRKALVVVEINDAGWPRVTGVMPPMRTATKAAPKPAAPVVEEESEEESEDGLPF